ncbi:hypothetical protein SAMN04487911_101251 [Arenibacter nanhaiticus]|uniref:PH domain-containing protein n=1 Tax=Arenibacter nanhaiticus TaxID=558155 RepID=A0A1M6AK87_9FLAO|nr:hypothetical protein [Arenibacter nanhaiticus]SHI36890.1 hypothetical protein SAMN04487911_101251 [Arenibacter nanhaiticus]
MKPNKKRPWLLNILIVVTLLVVGLAYTAHVKNWTKIEKDSFQILSGIYFLKIPFAELDSISMVKKIPSMERINGFSVKETEKGVFKDSIGEKKVYVYVDKLSQPKIRVVYQDSLQLFLNFSDSTETKATYDFLEQKINLAKE